MTLRPVLGCVAAPEPGATTTTVAGATTTPSPVRRRPPSPARRPRRRRRDDDGRRRDDHDARHAGGAAPPDPDALDDRPADDVDDRARPRRPRRPRRRARPARRPRCPPTPSTPPRRRTVRRSCARSTGASASSARRAPPVTRSSTATAPTSQLTQQEGWTVVVGLSGSGEAAWNAVAAECYNAHGDLPDRAAGHRPRRRDPVRPGRAAAERSAASVSISGSFTEGEARSLSRVLNRGAFPAKVEVERVDTVSPTLGKDSLQASIVAGLVGIALLVVILLLFYRRLTLLDRGRDDRVGDADLQRRGLHLRRPSNYALTLAGVTGIIVSIGMTVDSYVVYFERMKDEVLHGRTFKNSAAAQLPLDVADDPRRQPRVAHRRRGAVRAQRRFGPRLRAVPRRDDDLRRRRAVVLHPPGGDPARRGRSPRRSRSVRARSVAASRPWRPSHRPAPRPGGGAA